MSRGEHAKARPWRALGVVVPAVSVAAVLVTTTTETIPMAGATPQARSLKDRRSGPRSHCAGYRKCFRPRGEGRQPVGGRDIDDVKPRLWRRV